MPELRRTLTEDVWYPPHDPRRASEEYHRTHHKLVVQMDEPCWVCGIRNSDVQKLNPADRRSWQIETHHSELEWAAEKAFETDPVMLEKLITDLNGKTPQEHLASVVAEVGAVVHGDDPAALREFLDSEGNMLVLCATHHRAGRTGIHSITYPAWKLQRWQRPGGWVFAR